MIGRRWLTAVLREAILTASPAHARQLALPLQLGALGSTGEARLNAYVDQQLDPDSIVDSELDSRMATASFITMDKSLAQLWNQHLLFPIDDASRTLPFVEAERATFLRAIYSRRQLVEVLADDQDPLAQGVEQGVGTIRLQPGQGGHGGLGLRACWRSAKSLRSAADASRG